MHDEELEKFEQKYKDEKEIINIISYIRDLHDRIDRQIQVIEFLQEDIEMLKGERYKITEEDKHKIIKILDEKSYQSFVDVYDLLIFSSDDYIKVEGTPYLLTLKKIELVSRSVDFDIFKIVVSAGHKCPHNPSFFVDDEEIFVFKEVQNL